MNKKLILIIIFSFLLLFGAFLYIFRKKTPQPTPSTLHQQITPNPIQNISSLENKKTISDLAKQNAIKNSTVRDDLSNPVLLDKEYIKQYQLVENEEYEIMYQEKYDRYLITIHQKPFLELRKKAENEFVILIGLPKKDLCQLDVSTVIPYWIDEQYGHQNYRLSFCE